MAAALRAFPLDAPSPFFPPPSPLICATIIRYPDDATAAMYDGVACSADNPDAKCYNAAKWCATDDNCVADNGAYPFGDFPIFAKPFDSDSTGNEMLDPHALTPFPNAIFWNWATIIILAFGNLAAIDFQARCMAAKDEKTATAACLVAGCIGLAVGIPFSYTGAVTRYYYGPDSIHAEFEADTCSRILDLPTCALWLPDPMANLKLLTHEAPSFIGGWCLIGIVAASMSTSDGAILAMGTVCSHNILRNLSKVNPALAEYVTDEKLLMTTRVANLPFTLVAVLIAAFYSSDHSAGATGYLLIVAFDIVFAGCITIIFAAFYVENPSPNAALASVISGSLVRIILESRCRKTASSSGARGSRATSSSTTACRPRRTSPRSSTCLSSSSGRASTPRRARRSTTSTRSATSRCSRTSRASIRLCRRSSRSSSSSPCTTARRRRTSRGASCPTWVTPTGEPAWTRPRAPR